MHGLESLQQAMYSHAVEQKCDRRAIKTVCPMYTVCIE
jgi:hypothetical protein